MIAVDTSALIAIYLREPDAEAFQTTIFSAKRTIIAAPTALEFFMVATGSRWSGTRGADPRLLLDELSVAITPWAERHLAIAREAFNAYGKGQGHRAQLNFGDCISYALAKAENAPLLYKGGDFALTDVRAAL